ncbi:MAG: hypothetical protein HQM14_21875 [SAR324 cluster bacterium]|nr:hypothetical protein [SAR324 cluster bacterium]
MQELRLHLDSRKRITLSKLLPDLPISSVKAHLEGNKIVLEPMVEIPAEEAWLYREPESLKAVKKGLSQPGEHDLGSFEQFINDDV